MQDCAFRRETCGCSGFFGQCGDLKRVWKTMFAPAGLFFHRQASCSCHCRRVDDVHFLVQHSVEHARQHGAAKQTRSNLRYFARVADAYPRRPRMAAARSASLLSSPRAALMMRTPFFVFAMDRALIMSRVCGLTAVCSEIKSHSASS